MSKISSVYFEVFEERLRQEEKWGEQNHPILDDAYQKYPTLWFGRYTFNSAKHAKEVVEALSYAGKLTYMDIFLEEVHEAIECKSKEELREELIQCAAVAIAMVESLDRNGQ